ncbi:MAG: enoyl-CoA hydratase/isomerase family protein [Chloroflexi bacterium]|nr:enoyl-CoA hydratase/isomerase family protein [Chloroflexota bacterium]
MAFGTVLYETHDHIAWVTLNRPEKLNALNDVLRRDLIAALLAADTDDEVRCIVLRGAGRAFCAGADLSPSPGTPGGAFQARERTMREEIALRNRFRQPWMALWNITKPVICQVHGYCLAAGTHIATNSDIIIAAEDAQFGFPAVRNVGTPDTFMWPFYLRPQWTKWAMSTGDNLSGKEAERLGLVWKAVPADRLEDEVNALARKIARVSYEMLAASKEICNRAMELMGRRHLLQLLASEMDAIAGQSSAVKEFRRRVRDEGLRAALEWMNAPFREPQGR